MQHCIGDRNSLQCTLLPLVPLLLEHEYLGSTGSSGAIRQDVDAEPKVGPKLENCHDVAGEFVSVPKVAKGVRHRCNRCCRLLLCTENRFMLLEARSSYEF